jgi:hypothetical protein
MGGAGSSWKELGRRLKGSTLASAMSSRKPPGAAKMASAGIALATSMSWALMRRRSSAVSFWRRAALVSRTDSSPVSRTSCMRRWKLRSSVSFMLETRSSPIRSAAAETVKTSTTERFFA